MTQRQNLQKRANQPVLPSSDASRQGAKRRSRSKSLVSEYLQMVPAARTKVDDERKSILLLERARQKVKERKKLQTDENERAVGDGTSLALGRDSPIVKHYS
jgi:hypothetical protein